MRRAYLEQVIPLLPINNVEARELEPQSDNYFGVLRNPGGDIAWVIRDQENEADYTKQKPEFEQLQAHGIEVAKHIPFVAGYGSTFLMVEYIDGPRLDDWLREDPNPHRISVAAEHASKLARYYTDSLLGEGDGPLADVASEFQYLMRGDTPVLVDLDSSVGGYGKTSDEHKQRVLGHYLCDLGFCYGLILPTDANEALKQDINSVYAEQTGSSLFVPRTTDFDHTRFQW